MSDTSSRFSVEQLEALEEKHVRIVHLKGPPTRKAIREAEAAKEGKSAEERAGIKPSPAWEVVFRKPTRLEYKAFKRSTSRPEQQSDAQEVLARSCIVAVATGAGPTIEIEGQTSGGVVTPAAAAGAVRKAFDALLEDYPAIPEAASTGFIALSGLVGEEGEKA